jgi:hypothetical protein
MINLAGWHALQHMLVDVDSPILEIAMFEIIIRFFRRSSGATVEHMFASLTATYDKVHKRRLRWMVMHLSFVHLKSRASEVSLPRDEAFEMQGGEHHLDAKTDPLGFVCAMLGLTPGNDTLDSQSTEMDLFICECLRYLKAGSEKEGFRKTLDATICEALMLLIGEEREGTRRGVRNSLLRQGVLQIMADAVINNDCGFYIECLRGQRAFSHLLAELVKCFYDKELEEDMVHLEIPHVQNSRMLQAIQRVTVEIHKTTSRSHVTVKTSGLLRVLHAFGDLVLRPHASHSMPGDAFAIAVKAFEACVMVDDLITNNEGVTDAAVEPEVLARQVEHAKDCTLALSLATMQVYDDLDDQIVTLNDAWSGGVYTPQFLTCAMARYSHVPQIPTLYATYLLKTRG